VTSAGRLTFKSRAVSLIWPRFFFFDLAFSPFPFTNGMPPRSPNEVPPPVSSVRSRYLLGSPTYPFLSGFPLPLSSQRTAGTSLVGQPSLPPPLERTGAGEPIVSSPDQKVPILTLDVSALSFVGMRSHLLSIHFNNCLFFSLSIRGVLSFLPTKIPRLFFALFSPLLFGVLLSSQVPPVTVSPVVLRRPTLFDSMRSPSS